MESRMKPKWDPERLKENIERAGRNVKLFNESIRKENENLAYCRSVLKNFDLENEKAGGRLSREKTEKVIKAAENNLKVFENAILKEYESIVNLKKLLEEVESAIHV
jgi:hypothetical protein